MKSFSKWILFVFFMTSGLTQNMAGPMQLLQYGGDDAGTSASDDGASTTSYTDTSNDAVDNKGTDDASAPTQSDNSYGNYGETPTKTDDATSNSKNDDASKSKTDDATKSVSKIISGVKKIIKALPKTKPASKAHKAKPAPKARKAKPATKARKAKPVPKAHKAKPLPKARKAKPAPKAHKAKPVKTPKPNRHPTKHIFLRGSA